MSQINRYCVLKEEHNGENVFRAHRGYIMGNPYTHIKNKQTKAQIRVKTREEAINRYARYFEESLRLNPDFKEEFERMIDSCLNNEETWIGCSPSCLIKSCMSVIISSNGFDKNARKECSKDFHKKKILLKKVKRFVCFEKYL